MSELTWSMLTEQDHAEIRALYGAGVGVDNIAAAYGLKAESLGRKLRLLAERERHGLQDHSFGRIHRIRLLEPSKVLFYGDLHAPYANPWVMLAVIRIAELFAPDVVFNLGDTIDAKALSKYAQDSESALLGTELALWKAWAQELNSVLGDDTQKYILRGNHDRRVYRSLPVALRSLPSMSLDTLLSTQELGYYPIQDVIEVNARPTGGAMLYVMHGQYASSVAGSAARKMSERLATSSVVVGHNHKSAYTTRRTPRGVTHSYEVGCMQDFSIDWDLYPDWTHSVLVGRISAEGQQLQHVMIDPDGSFVWDGIRQTI